MALSLGAFDLPEILEAALDKARDVEAHVAGQDARIATLEEGVKELDEANAALGVELEEAQARILVLAEQVDESDRIAQAVLAAHKLGGNAAVAELLDAAEASSDESKT
jgi:septal ring factor EnvC (AmiA/AmiB activator)